MIFFFGVDTAAFRTRISLVLPRPLRPAIWSLCRRKADVPVGMLSLFLLTAAVEENGPTREEPARVDLCTREAEMDERCFPGVRPTRVGPPR